MFNTGDTLLYISIATATVALLGLLLKERKRSNLLSRLIAPMVFLTASLLVLAYLLITYYFATSNFTYEYVWQYSSRDLPLIYKISGVWAGQQGTYLLWAMVVSISAAWFTHITGLKTPLARRMQIVTLLISIYLVVLTLIQTPFKSIYEYPNIPPGFVPADGNGLNALLVNFWMIVHPPVLFIGYATMTIPFASAVVYLITRDKEWEAMSRQWARFTWLFLGMGIAIGGVWAYLVLGWGGFWAWDPVETASLVPWLTLTGYLHASALHRRNSKIFSIASPMLAVISFILVLYAALVVRSGLFNSVHAFGEATTGSFLITLILIITFVTFGIVLWRYLGENTVEEERSFWSKTNIFYATLLLFVVLAFISFWGITFPTVIRLYQGVKVGIASDTKNFFNVWSYPFTLILLLVLGFCLNYKETEKAKQIKTLLIVGAVTIATMFLRTKNFYVLDHNSPFFVSEPQVYKIIGSISLISIFPPLVYAAVSVYQYFINHLNNRQRIKAAGVASVHIAVVLILFGAVVSSTLTNSMQANIPLTAKGEIVDIGNGYSIKLLDFSIHSLTQKPITSIIKLLSSPDSYADRVVRVKGRVTNIKTVEGHGTLVELTDNTGSIWVMMQENTTIPMNHELTITGRIMSFGTPVLIPEQASKYIVQRVELEVYHNDKKVGSGAAEYLEGGDTGSGTFPMVDMSIGNVIGDVYVIFQGMGGNVIPLTLKIIPAINFTWAGIILFVIGMVMIMAVKTRR